MNLRLLVISLLASVVAGVGNPQAQVNELRRQYFNYLQIFKKVERPFSFDIFLENLSRIAHRQCDYFIDKSSDEELTYVECHKGDK
jgi:hypothetical protein